VKKSAYVAYSECLREQNTYTKRIWQVVFLSFGGGGF
jgi:hypothetical protein